MSSPTYARACPTCAWSYTVGPHVYLAAKLVESEYVGRGARWMELWWLLQGSSVFALGIWVDPQPCQRLSAWKCLLLAREAV
jgi:hypothetical protein